MDPYNGTFELVDPADLHFDRKYQRPQKWDLIAAIAQAPNWGAFGVVICSKREHAGGLLYCLDGQQRLNGVLTSKSPPATVPVTWFPVKTVREEATLFTAININRKSVAALEKFHASIAGEDQRSLQIAAAVERAGFTIGGTNESAFTLSAITALHAVYNEVGEEGVYIALAAIREGWSDDKNATSSPMLRGIAEVLSESRANGGMDASRLAAALAKTSPGRIMRKAEEIRFDQGGSKKTAVRKAFKALARV